MRFLWFAAVLRASLVFPESQSLDSEGCAYSSSVSVAKHGCPCSRANPRGQRLSTWSRRSQSKGGIFFISRIAPGISELFIANADGSDERKLLGSESTFEYHASFSPDGSGITFTTERNGDGNSDIYRVRADGSNLSKTTTTPSFEDAAVISPNGTKGAYVSTANNYKANIWVQDLATGKSFNLTNTDMVKGNDSLPESYLRPLWSPDDEWLAFSSDRNTQWRGHGIGTGWEHPRALYLRHQDQWKRLSSAGDKIWILSRQSSLVS
ncbi:hypothetical protein E8E11_001771 [Didymella keratinophila]|nr:hypothetical protein E8E11_001771 [Didymella keratinophila]